MKTTKLLPPTYMLISLIAMVILHFIFPGMTIIPQPWNLAGIISVALGVAINLIADGKFHEVKTTVKPFEQSSELVTSGVFRISRNPMYLGFIFILAGIAILLGSLSPYLIVVLFGLAMEKVFIEAEEKMLEAKFGSQWTKYKTSVRRWL